MSYRWVVKYLPEKYKDLTQSQRRSRSNSVARSASEFLAKVRGHPKRKDASKISKYGNTEFTNSPGTFLP